MRSVLLATDLIRRNNGSWTPTEINTNAGHLIPFDYPTDPIAQPVVDFMPNFASFFNHIEFNDFLQTNGITKLVVIDKAGNICVLFESFASYYNYEYELVVAIEGSLTVPNIDDADDILIIRVAYDTYALVDDLYARDMFEFHNIIKNESFASPVTFNTGDENNIDTITEFEPSIDGTVPNYLIKPRTPGYAKGDYPKLYRLDTVEELNALKADITENEFIQKYEYNEELGLVNNRTSFVRSMDLIYGPNLDVMNVVTYKAMNAVSTQNSLLQYESEVLPDKRLNSLFATKWLPKHFLLNDRLFHFDATDSILMPDGTDKIATELTINEEILGISFNQAIKHFQSSPVSTLETYTTGSSHISVITKNSLNCIFINISAVDSDNKQYDWYDGIGNLYLLQKPGSSDAQYISQTSGFIEVGDTIFVLDTLTNLAKPLTVTSIHYDIKDIPTYKISLGGDKKEFMIKLDENIYLVQHNAFCAEGCGSFIFCNNYYCFGCGKYDFGCPNCSFTYGQGVACFGSDRRLKENIILVGKSENGINIYQFKYIGKEGLYEGVIAQELLGTKFESAVVLGEDGMYAVDYSKIDVELKKIN
jgi:hypothetical protein